MVPDLNPYDIYKSIFDLIKPFCCSTSLDAHHDYIIMIINKDNIEAYPHSVQM